jgi:hypothetical protein
MPRLQGSDSPTPQVLACTQCCTLPLLVTCSQAQIGFPDIGKAKDAIRVCVDKDAIRVCVDKDAIRVCVDKRLFGL